MGSHLALGLRVADPLAVVAGRGGARRGGRPGSTLQGRHLRGEYLEFWHLHCNVLASVYIYF